MSLILASLPPEKINKQSSRARHPTGTSTALNISSSSRIVDVLLWQARGFGHNHPCLEGNPNPGQAINLWGSGGSEHSAQVSARIITFARTHPDSLYSMFLHVKMKALVQSVRFIVFSILDSLVADHRDGLSFKLELLLPI